MKMNLTKGGLLTRAIWNKPRRNNNTHSQHNSFQIRSHKFSNNTSRLILLHQFLIQTESQELVGRAVHTGHVQLPRMTQLDRLYTASLPKCFLLIGGAGLMLLQSESPSLTPGYMRRSIFLTYLPHAQRGIDTHTHTIILRQTGDSYGLNNTSGSFWVSPSWTTCAW